MAKVSSKNLTSANYEYRSKLQDLMSAWSVTYQMVASDLTYCSGGVSMWDRPTQNLRQGQQKPLVSLPLIPPYCERIVAPVRVHPPGMSVRTDDPKVQTLVNGMLRAIERASSSTDAYSQALSCSVKAGLGWLYLAIEDGPNGPEIRIKSEIDPTVIMIDPLSTSICGEDAQYACYRGYMDKGKAVREYGEEAGMNPIDAGLAAYTLNVPTGAVLDCIWYTIEQEGLKITRTVGRQEVFSQTFKGVYRIPVVPVIGERLFGANGRRYGGLVTKAKDINDSVNMAASTVMELVASAPRSPWIGPWEAFENFRDAWATANTEPHAYLPYKHKDKEGNIIPAPMRLDNSPQTQAVQGVAEWFMGMLGRVTGISDAMLGGLETANESGKSLIARMEAAEGASSQYIDHLTTSITQLARVLVDLLPIVYAGERSLTVIDDDGRSARIHGDISKVLTPDVVHMLDIEIESGPSMELKRRNASDALAQIIQTAGDKGFALMDLWAETQDLPNAQKVQDRIKKLMPPELLPADPNDPHAQQIDPQAMQALQSANDAIQQKDSTIQYMEGLISQLQQQLADQSALYGIELRKAEINAQTTLTKAQMDNEAKKELELLRQGSEDVRVATKLSAEQQKQINDLIAQTMLKNQQVLSVAKEELAPEPMLGEEHAAARLPGFVAAGVAKAENGTATQDMLNQIKNT